MAKSLLDKARDWNPDPADKYGKDKQSFLHYLCDNACGIKNAIRIANILAANHFEHEYTKENCQLLLIGPLREVPDLFIGTSKAGIYLIDDAQDAYETIRFYTHRIRSEKKHLNNLKRLAKRNKLFEKHNIVQKIESKTTIYFDESGTPSLADKTEQPFFIVTAVVFEGNRPDVLLKKKMDAIKQMLGKPGNYELKSTRLNSDEYTLVLKELSTIDYEYATIVFVKEKLTGEGFEYSKSFYKYAYQFLLNNVLDNVGDARLFFDEYGGKDSAFKIEFFDYLREQNTGFPLQKIEQTEMLESRFEPFIQIADLVAGVFKYYLKGKMDLRNLIEEKELELKYFPYAGI